MNKDKAATFHDRAKDSGNKLKTYLLSVSSGAAGVFFFKITSSSDSDLKVSEIFLISSLICFLITISLLLYELHLDSRRYYIAAKQHEKKKEEQNWNEHEALKTKRKRLLLYIYFFFTLGILATIVHFGFHLHEKVNSPRGQETTQ